LKSTRGTESTSDETSTTLAVRVIPRSSREEVAGFSGDVVRIRLTAPPVENRANEALVRFLSRTLDVPRRQIGIVSGGTGRRKIVRVAGVAREDIFRRLGLE
jgi:uncharacterized protein (TIGR00251 family)